jgi:acetyl-CoA acetyltransferase
MGWASRHAHQYGTIGEQLAVVAVASLEWVLLNCSMGKKPLTIDEVLSAHMVSYPFTVRDCCLITDGGGAVIMTTAERAPSLKNRPYMSSAAARRLLMPIFEHAESDRDRGPEIGARGLRDRAARPWRHRRRRAV